MFYTYSALDRADYLRKDGDALAALRQRSDARIVPIWQGKSLVNQPSQDALPQVMFLAHDCPVPDGQSVFLGLHTENPYFAVDVSQLDESARDELAALGRSRDGTPLASEFTDLRVAGPVLSNEDGSLLAYAQGLMYWNSNTLFCIRCGHPLTSVNGGHVRCCSNENCGYLAFPRTDPAVIMLVIHTPDNGEEPVCLLGRSPGWPDGVFSTLAGFVEPGESLELAVEREVFEESSITTTDVRYVASQPWPFPRSIMLGFEATATSTDIECDPIELADAQWFTRSQLRDFGNWGDDTPGFKLPRHDSISRFLIERWLANDT